MTTYLNLCEPPYNLPRFESRDAALAGATSQALVRRQAFVAASAARVPVVLPSGFFPVEESIDTSGLPDLEFLGAGSRKTHLVATSALNGSHNLRFNDLVHSLNWSPILPEGGYPLKNYRGGGMTLDCTEQNFSGLTEAIRLGKFGHSLSCWEVMDVDNVELFDLEVLRPFGNGPVISTSDPRLVDQYGRRVGTDNPRMRNIDITEALRGLLPQYWSPWAPGGITGTGIQIGSCFDGLIENVRMTRLSGPAIDLFNVKNLRVRNVTIRDFGSYAVGSSLHPGLSFQQMAGGIRSDFGLIDCLFENIMFDGIGGFYTTGNQDIFFQNGGVPTVGPNGCTFSGIKMRRPYGIKQIQAPTLGGNGSVYPHRTVNDTYTYPVLITFYGGAGINLLVYRKGYLPEVVPLSKYNTAVIDYRDIVQVYWNSKPISWKWELAPNVRHDGILVMGGTIPGSVAQAANNTFRDIDIENPGRAGIAFVDSSGNRMSNIRVTNPGAVYPAPSISSSAGSDKAGAGSKSNQLSGGVGWDTRSPPTMPTFYSDGPLDTGCSLDQVIVGPITGQMIDTHAGARATNFSGPGATA